MNGQIEGLFYGESRVWGFPLQDLNGLPVGQPQIMTASAAPLQLNTDGDWQVYGMSAMIGTIAGGGIPTGTALDFAIEQQDTSERWFRQSNQTTISGMPLSSIAGKAGNTNYFGYSRQVKAGSRLIPYVQQNGLATPTGRTPLYVQLHAAIVTPKQPAMEIGSKYEQMKRFGGFYTWYTGRLTFSAAAPLTPNQDIVLTIPIAGKKFFFVDTLVCEQTNPATGLGVQGPVNALNPLVQEQELLVSIKDTTSLSPWTLPTFQPLWSVFGDTANRPYHPPSYFAVRPNGNIELTLRNGPTANFTQNLTFTFGGVLVDLGKDPAPDALVQR